ncbi:MAG TPA: hypothetical protein VH701_24145 [Vicinamibacterales bacterium]|jgi:hypothetical protein
MKQYNFGPDFLDPEFKRCVYGYRALVKALVPTPVVALTKAAG